MRSPAGSASPPSLISQIERNKVNPSVSTLWSLVTVLGLSMGDLFSELDTPPGPPSAPPAAAEAPTPAQGSRPVINLKDGVTWERLTAERDAVVE